MFRCRECQSEYEIKPDYCDCGNDTFEEIFDEINIQDISDAKSEKINVCDLTQKDIKKREKISKPNKISEKKSFSQQYPEISRLKKYFDPISTTIFGICIILSILVILFVANPKPKFENENNVQKKEQTLSMPTSLDGIWNNSTVGVKTDVLKTPTETLIQKEEIVKPTNIIQKEEITKDKSIKNPLKKSASQVKNPKNNIETSKIQSKTVLKPVVIKNTKNIPSATSAASKQELSNYKISLRNKIASRIDFASVVGDGSCVVSFKISSSGKIINRAFAKQSENISLNDVVYRAIMSVPTYSAPPSAYNGATLHLNVKMNGGNFEVSLH